MQNVRKKKLWGNVWSIVNYSLWNVAKSSKFSIEKRGCLSASFRKLDTFAAWLNLCISKRDINTVKIGPYEMVKTTSSTIYFDHALKYKLEEASVNYD